MNLIRVYGKTKALDKLQKWFDTLTPKEKKLTKIAGRSSREVFDYIVSNFNFRTLAQN